MPPVPRELSDIASRAGLRHVSDLLADWLTEIGHAHAGVPVAAPLPEPEPSPRGEQPHA